MALGGRAGGVLRQHDMEIVGVVNSSSGLYLLVHLGFPLQVGSVARLEWDELLLVGEVDYCRAKGPKFLVGLNVPPFPGAGSGSSLPS